MTATVALTLLIVVIALVFDFTNGFHDAANSIATVVSTRVLSPRYAVIWAATFNFIAFAVFGTRVAKTIGGDLVRIDLIQPNQRLYVLCAGLIGAIIWNLITWYLGLPTSSSHALVGGYAGAAVAAYHGISLLKPEGWIKTLIFIVASPVIGFSMGFVLMVAVYWIFHRWTPAQVDKTFRRGQLLSAAAYSLGHGGNDAQKTMGIVTAVCSYNGLKDHQVAAGWRLLRRNCGSYHALRCYRGRNSGVHNPYYHRCNRRSWIDDATVRSQVACGREDRVGLGLDYSGRRYVCRVVLLYYPIGLGNCRPGRLRIRQRRNPIYSPPTIA